MHKASHLQASGACVYSTGLALAHGLARTGQVCIAHLCSLPVRQQACSTSIGSWLPRPWQADKQLPDEFVLEVDLQRLELVEQLPSDPLAVLKGAARQVSCMCGVGCTEAQ